MVDMAEMFGADPAKAREELLEVLEFETNLANVSFYFKKQLLILGKILRFLNKFFFLKLFFSKMYRTDLITNGTTSKFK